ncbi:hypothetical protein NDU88_009831 [Pleurodeles waltl]|uniref:Uncharacterized protein n=1 Tax=Pleurodeles waltl TaxID=8319 RepID=A0AAV7Q0H3_PLEWA|nr:hypothetical protein NDU88_009831 [Pleurodeles waltl]
MPPHQPPPCPGFRAPRVEAAASACLLCYGCDIVSISLTDWSLLGLVDAITTLSVPTRPLLLSSQVYSLRRISVLLPRAEPSRQTPSADRSVALTPLGLSQITASRDRRSTRHVPTRRGCRQSLPGRTVPLTTLYAANLSCLVGHKLITSGGGKAAPLLGASPSRPHGAAPMMVSRLSGPTPCTVCTRLLSAPRPDITAAPHSLLPSEARVRGRRRYRWAGTQPSAPSLSMGPEARPGRQLQPHVALLLLLPPEQAWPRDPPHRHSGAPSDLQALLAPSAAQGRPAGEGQARHTAISGAGWRSSERRGSLLF